MIIPDEVSQKGKDKCHVMPRHVESGNMTQNELIYRTEAESQTGRTKLWLTKGKGGKKGINKEFELADTKHYNKIDKQIRLLYSTGV